MKRLLVSIFVMTMALFAMANDGVYYTSGNQLIPLIETDIQVKKEILTISLQDNKRAKVDVYYEFLNPGSKAKTVKMGFEADPSYNDDYEFHKDGKHPRIYDFTVEVNGMGMTYQNAVCNLDKAGLFNPIDVNKWELEENSGISLINKENHDVEINRFAYVYYFNAEFKPGINKIHHTYSYEMSESVGRVFSVDYKLSPAARWANHQIDDFTLVIRADKTAKHFYVSKNVLGKSKFTVTEGQGKMREKENAYEFSLRNGAITMHKNNFRIVADNDELGELNIYSADSYYDVEGESKFGDFYDRSSSVYVEMYEYMNDKWKISPAMYKRIAKNLPYAHRGHVFKDAALKKYFQSLWWYMPDPSYKDDTSDFTETDWEYVRKGK